MAGEAFCDNCGAPLLGATRPGAPTPAYGSVPPQPAYPPPRPVAPVTPPSVSHPPPVAPATPPRTTLAPARLVVQPSGAVVALPAAPQALVGRADAVSNFFPDVDLTDHDGINLGVGRRHARLFVQAGQMMVVVLE
ncbi:MAG: hypothetical protein SNJ69_14875, partial [Chloroflexaceae bacterium]